MPTSTKLPTVSATRYVTPLREGGSLPGLMEGSDDGLYVVKFRAAGQGTLALAAEVIAAELARSIGIPVPRTVLIDVDPAIGAAEPDPEIQELILASPGLNLGSDFLPGARSYSPAEEWRPAAEAAAAIVWLDAFLTNVDRSARNPNLLVWHDELWAIDHGAALFRQHSGLAVEQAELPFAQLAEHVLLDAAGSIEVAGQRAAAMLDSSTLERAVDAVPQEWFGENVSAGYVEYLGARLARSPEFSREAEVARGD
jgi:hypothetical protein